MNTNTDTLAHAFQRKLLSELKVRHLANVFIAASVFIVLGTTLYPFDFTTEEIDQRLTPFLHQDLANLQAYQDDIITNIFLFVPIGISFGILATRKKLTFSSALFVVTISGALLSLAVELLQLFLPFRYSSMLDVLANAAGSAIGCLVYKALAHVAYGALTDAIERINKGHKVGWLATLYLLYLCCLLAGSWPLQKSSFLTEFDTSDYPLAVGNEPGGSRPWNGSASELVIAKHPFSLSGVSEYLEGRTLNDNDTRDVVAHYVFQGKGPYPDLTGTNQALEWKGKSPDTLDEAENTRARISSLRWLQTAGAAQALSELLMDTYRYTICMTVSSNESRHSHIARIVAVASNPYRQNFSIVQIGDDLGIRFRSMTTGINGTNPQFMVNNVFRDTLTHRIVVLVSPSHLRVFVDRLENRYEIELGPGFTFLNKFFPTNGKLSISSPMKNFHRVLFAVMVFVPLGYLLALLVSELQRGVLLRIIIASAGIFAPPYLLERMLCHMTGREISAPNLAIGCALMLGTLLMTLSSQLYRARTANTNAERE